MHPGRTLLILGLLVSSVAHADPKADKAEATKHYELGKRHYNLNEWDDAIAEFKAAYLLFPGLALFAVTWGFNALGDGLRDALDPRWGAKR